MNRKFSLVESYYYILGRIASQSATRQSLVTDVAPSSDSGDIIEPNLEVFAHGGIQTSAELLPWSVPLLVSSQKSGVDGRFYGSATLLDGGYVLFTKHQLLKVRDDPELKNGAVLEVEFGTNSKQDHAPRIQIEKYIQIRGHDLMVGKLAERTFFEKGCIAYELPDNASDALLPNSNAMGLFSGWGSNKSGSKFPLRLKNDVVIPVDRKVLPPKIESGWKQSWKDNYGEGFDGRWEVTHFWTIDPNFSPAPNDSGGALVMLVGKNIHLIGIAIKHPLDIVDPKIGLYLNIANLKASILEACRSLA